jgi:acetoin utilization deacetylase AcuC-like enzyme
MGKYALVRDGVVALGVLPEGAIHEPDRATPDALRLVHGARYIDAVLDGTLTESELRRIGFPWTPLMPERSRRTVQGTLEAARDALSVGAGINLAGGTHHAFPDHGEGYCVFNDVAVAIRVLQREGIICRAAIIDLDVHQGNGTAKIFEDDPDVFTFSIHGSNNYPFRKERSRLDLELPDRTGDHTYLEVLESHLPSVLERARPELVVYIGGADPYREDRLGRLGLSIEGLRLRDRMVFGETRRRGLPVVMALGGGYAREMEDLVTIHANTVRELIGHYGSGHDHDS